MFSIFFQMFIAKDSLFAQQSVKEYVYITNPYSAGLFSYYLTVLGTLENYELGRYGGFEVAFGLEGLYYDEKYGPNWWEYYFEPLSLGSKINSIHRLLSAEESSTPSFYARDHLSRQRANQLIKKYIKIKKNIQDEVDLFIEQNFKEYIIGIHFRGTDKFSIGESQSITYFQMLDSILQFIKQTRLKKFKIFIATDEAKFIHFMEECFPGRIIFQDAIRSENDDPIHVESPSPYQVGKEALIDAMLLSRCNYLIRTVSNLSLCSTYMNPYIYVKTVN